MFSVNMITPRHEIIILLYTKDVFSYHVAHITALCGFNEHHKILRVVAATFDLKHL